MHIYYLIHIYAELIYAELILNNVQASLHSHIRNYGLSSYIYFAWYLEESSNEEVKFTLPSTTQHIYLVIALSYHCVPSHALVQCKNEIVKIRISTYLSFKPCLYYDVAGYNYSVYVHYSCILHNRRCAL